MYPQGDGGIPKSASALLLHHVLVVRHALHCLLAEHEPATRSYWAMARADLWNTFTHLAFVAISRVRATSLSKSTTQQASRLKVGQVRRYGYAQ